MQTTKLLFIIGLGATLVAFTLTSGARDTEQQIKAREALRQKMSELNAPSVTAPPPAAPAPPLAPAAPAKPATPPPPAAPAPVVAPQKKAPVVPTWPTPATAIPRDSKFAPATETVDDANTARARAAVRREMAALDGMGEGMFGPVPNAVKDAKTSQMQAALRQEMARLQRTPAGTRKLARTGQPSGVTAPLLPPPPVMEVPLSPLTGAKAARLAELLQRYDADQITPKEYHTQRAAIVAEP